MKTRTVKFVCAAQLSLMVDEDSEGCAVLKSFISLSEIEQILC